MAVQRLQDERELLGPIRSAAFRLKENPKVGPILARLAFLCQPEPINLAMADRLSRSDSTFFTVCSNAFLISASLLANVDTDQQAVAIEKLGPERSRRIFAISAVGSWAAYAAPLAGLKATLLAQQAAAIGFAASRLQTSDETGAYFAAGAMINVGIPFMALLHQDRYAALWNFLADSTATLEQAERDAFGYSHLEAGAILADVLGMKAPIVEATLMHHASPHELKELCLTMALAERIAHHFGYDGGIGNKQPDLPTTWMIRYGLKVDPLGMADEMAREAALAASFFGA
jgi:hypothetical protein